MGSEKNHPQACMTIYDSHVSSTASNVSTGVVPIIFLSGPQSLGGIVGRKLYVGNLPYSATESDLSEKFAESGTVESCKLITDRDTGQSKGFGFVEMATDGEAQAAIDRLNGTDYDGRPMKVNEAKPQERRSGGGGGGRW